MYICKEKLCAIVVRAIFSCHFYVYIFCEVNIFLSSINFYIICDFYHSLLLFLLTKGSLGVFHGWYLGSGLPEWTT